MSDGFIIKYSDLYQLEQLYQENLESLMKECDECSNRLSAIINDPGFTGAASAAVKRYLTEVHKLLLQHIQEIAQNMLDNFILYKASYFEVDSSTDFILHEALMNSFRSSLNEKAVSTISCEDAVNGAINSISDIFYCGKPSAIEIYRCTDQLKDEITQLGENTNHLEQITVQALRCSVEEMLCSLQSSIAYAGTVCSEPGSYRAGSYAANYNVSLLSAQCKNAQTQHEQNEHIYSELWEAERLRKERADERATEGIWKTIGGIGLIVTGTLCIVATAGAATPAVVAAGTIAGGGTILFGVADAEEGVSDIYYGKTGNIHAASINGLRDTLFMGNEQAYYTVEGVFAFTASAMVPIAQSAVAENLTLRSGAVAVGKLAVSQTASQVASQVVTEVTDNRVLGMLAGMGVGYTTTVGMNRLDAKFDISGVNKITPPEPPAINGDESSSVRVPIPGDADYTEPVSSGSWTLAPDGEGAHLVERSNVRGRPDLACYDTPDTPRYYPYGSPENAGQAHIRLHEATRTEGIKLRGGNPNLNDAQLLQKYTAAYNNPSLNGIRGDLKLPNGKIIASDVTPSQAITALFNWANNR